MEAVVGRYRRVRCGLWLDSAFLKLSDRDQRVALYCLTGPYTNGLGLYRLPPAAAADDLRHSPQVFTKCFEAVCRAFDWRFDATARVLWMPGWLADNAPQSPNVVKSWRAAFNEIPECSVKAEAATAIQAFLKDKGEAFLKAFGEVFGDSSRIRDQDQGTGSGSGSGTEAEAKTALRAGGQAPNSKSNGTGLRERFEAFWKVYPKKFGKKAAWRVWQRLRPTPDLTQQMIATIAWQRQQDEWIRDGGQYIPYPATWLNAGRWEDERSETPHISGRTLTTARAAEEFLK